MPREAQSLLFVGIKGTVVALDDRTGTEVWRTDVSGSDYVTVLWDGAALFAAGYGEVFRLDPATGGLLWQNALKGLGRGLAGLASSASPSGSNAEDGAAKKRRDAAAANAASAAAASA
jgi:outer membrane protein assembly factor BamB